MLRGWSWTTPIVTPCSVGSFMPSSSKGTGAKMSSRSGAGRSGLDRKKAIASTRFDVSGPREHEPAQEVRERARGGQRVDTGPGADREAVGDVVAEALPDSGSFVRDSDPGRLEHGPRPTPES
jgi:hypothetical protein